MTRTVTSARCALFWVWKIGPWDRAIVKVSNTEDRKLKLTAAISQVLEDGKITGKPSRAVCNLQRRRFGAVGLHSQ